MRARIDAVDRELLELLNRRAALALDVGAIKKREGSPTFRPEREAPVIDGLKAANPGPAAGDSVAPIWREIMSACRALEAPTRVAYLGPAGTFSERAALGFFGSSIVKVRLRRASTRCSAPPAAGGADFGVVPVENSTEGVVARSLDLLLRTPLVIIGETSLFVGTTCCAARRSTASRRSAPTRRRWPSATAGSPPPAARRAAAGRRAMPKARGWRASTRRSRRSPATRAASEYGLHRVAPAIQDEPHNRTRFAIVADPSATRCRRPRGTTAPAWWSRSTNRPGAVHDLLVPLKAHGVSMSRFESRPARSGQWEYYFYIDLEGSSRRAGAWPRALQRAARACAPSSSCSAATRSTCTDGRTSPSRLVSALMFKQLGLIGCGLMGGSFALALKRAGSSARHRLQQVAVDHRARKRLGVIDAAAESALLAVSGSDIVLIAVPVAATEATFKAIRELIEPGVLLMDVGSTKRDVVDAARRVLKDRIDSFVPAHPIAGKEVAGIAHADAALYQAARSS